MAKASRLLFKLGILISMLACQPGITDLDFLLLCDKVLTTIKKKKDKFMPYSYLLA